MRRFTMMPLLLGALACAQPEGDRNAHRSCEGLASLPEQISLEVPVEVCGEGWLRVQDAERRTNLVEAELRRDADGLLVDAENRVVLGVSASEPELDLVFIPEVSPSIPTSEMVVTINLNRNASGSGPFDPSDPSSTSDYQTSTTVYGGDRAMEVQLFFVNQGAGSWEVVPMGERRAAAMLDALGRMMLTFAENGVLTAEPTEMEAPWDPSGRDMWTLRFSSESTSTAAPAGVQTIEQNGRASGELVDLQLTPRGEVRALYSNGSTDSWWILDGVEGWLIPML